HNGAPHRELIPGQRPHRSKQNRGWLPAVGVKFSAQPSISRPTTRSHPMSFTLPDLPYKYDALAPYMSRETLEYHHDKHHLAYRNRRPDYLKAFMDHLVNWEYVAKMYDAAMK